MNNSPENEPELNTEKTVNVSQALENTKNRLLNRLSSPENTKMPQPSGLATRALGRSKPEFRNTINKVNLPPVSVSFPRSFKTAQTTQGGILGNIVNPPDTVEEGQSPAATLPTKKERRASFCGDLGTSFYEINKWKAVGSHFFDAEGNSPEGEECGDEPLGPETPFLALQNFPDPLFGLQERRDVRERRVRSKSLSALSTQKNYFYQNNFPELVSLSEDPAGHCASLLSDFSLQAEQYPSSTIYNENDTPWVQKTTAPAIVSNNGNIYVVAFKGGRFDVFFLKQGSDLSEEALHVGLPVFVEADRGIDLGVVEKIFEETVLRKMARKKFGILRASEEATLSASTFSAEHFVTLLWARAIQPKQIYGVAKTEDIQQWQTQRGEEETAVAKCQELVLDNNLPMIVVDAEYQWDRKKLTFIFVSERRIDFRELVRELFRHYKTRIWMCSVDRRRLPLCPAEMEPLKGTPQCIKYFQ